MAKKQKLIKWTSEDERKLERTINQFNARVKKLKSTRKDKRYLPEELSFIGTKRLIKTKAELNRVIKNLSEFKGKEAYKKVELKSGVEITAWEKKKLEREKRTALRKLKKELSKMEKPYYKMGSPEYQRTKNLIESIKDFSKLKGRKLQEIKNKIENIGSSDYEMRRAVQFRKNYMTMLRKNYQNYDNYLRLVRRLNKIKNPLDFYNLLINSKYADNVKDIIYMYDAEDGEEVLESLLDDVKEAEEKEAED